MMCLAKSRPSLAPRRGGLSSGCVTGQRPIAIRLLLCCLAVGLGGLAKAQDAAQTAAQPVPAAVTFERDVMSVLSKASCNAGTCHGNVNGKGGFFLSLRGQDPADDYRQIVRSAAGRRIDRLTPDQSLVLLKATAAVAHEGGKRFDERAPEYQILARWIEQGLPQPDLTAPSVIRLEVTPANSVLWAPTDELALQVTAVFSDETRRDISRLAVYESSDPTVKITAEGVVRFAQPGMTTILVRYLNGQFPVQLAYREAVDAFVWDGTSAENFIDEQIFARLQQLRIQPAPLAEDNVFLRRLSLDLLGVLPTAEEAREFVADTAVDKRRRWVDRFLARPEFAALWALKWSDLLRNEEKTLDAQGVERLHGWMRQRFADDQPLDSFVRDLIASRGSTYQNPPANYWRALREPFVRAETTAQVFLGVRLQCAKCHNHPFDRWSQDEYYQWSSLFAGIDYEIVANERRDKLDSHEFVGEQIVLIKNEGEVKNARTGQPAAPKFLGGNEPLTGDRLEHLAAWITRPDNRMFAEAQANRIWYHLMGAGLVDPVDDLRLTNPASHPELLARLADELIASGYSLKHLVRTIVLSRGYQLASQSGGSPGAGPESAPDPRLYASAIVRRLSAEQLLDAQSQVLALPASFEGYDPGTQAGQIAGVERVRRKLASGDVFLKQFGKPERLLSCECERSDEPTLGQALSLVGGASLNERLRQPDNRIGQLLAATDDHRQVVETLFWTALGRSPSDDETAAVLESIRVSGQPRAALEDLTWALLNAKELIFRN